MHARVRFAALAGVTLWSSVATATYSIVGSDTATRQIGGAGTSCLSGGDVYIIYGSAPGFGVVHAQATANQAARDRAVSLLEQGLAPADVMASITDATFDPNAAVRQYAIVDVSGRSVGFTGDRTLTFAADHQGRSGTFGYSVQGNILTGDPVLTRAAAAFEAPACDLGERLLKALEAGAENGEGDSRCTSRRGIPSDSAFLQVDAPDAPRGGYLALRVPSSGARSPLLALRAAFDEWRRLHPCGKPGASGGTGGAGADGDATAGATSGGVTSAAGSGGTSSSPGRTGEPISGASGSASSAGASGRETMRIEGRGSGCSCALEAQRAATSERRSIAALLSLMALGIVRRRHAFFF